MMKKYIIEGNHPIFKYINWTAVGLKELNQKISELEDAGYEIIVKPQLSENVTEKIAKEIYDWLNNLKSEAGEWVVDPHEFLPANVTCDFVGKMNLIKGMNKIIESNFKEKE